MRSEIKGETEGTNKNGRRAGLNALVGATRRHHRDKPADARINDTATRDFVTGEKDSTVQ